RPGSADRGHSYSFLSCRSANDDLVADGETVHVADLDVGRADARVSREIRASRLGAHTRDFDVLDSVSVTLDVQPDLVTDGDVGDRSHLDIGRAGGRIRSQVGLRARLPDGRDRDNFVSLYASCNVRVSRAVADRHLLAYNETTCHAGDRHVGGTCGDRNYWAIRNRLPYCRAVARGGPDACNFAGF